MPAPSSDFSGIIFLVQTMDFLCKCTDHNLTSFSTCPEIFSFLKAILKTKELTYHHRKITILTRTRRKHQVYIKMEKCVWGWVGGRWSWVSSFLMHDPNSSLSKMTLVFQTYNSDLQVTRIYFRNSNKDYVSMMPPVVCCCLPQTLSWQGFWGHAGDHGATGRAVWAHKAWNCGT